MEKISIIVPVYNVEKYLKRCIDSIINQTYKNLEIILVDDESPDKAGILCEEYKSRDNRIKVIHKKNGGLGYARNSGLEIATGEYVTFIDSDDWISDNHIENLYNEIKEYNADICIGGYTTIDDDNHIREYTVKLKEKVYDKNNIIEQIVLPLIAPDTNFKYDVQLESSSCMNLYRMSMIKKYQLHFISEKQAVSEDLFFNIDYLYNSNKVVTTKQNSYFYYKNTNSISRKYDSDRFIRTINFYFELEKKLKTYKLLETADLRLKRSYITKIRVAITHIIFSDLKCKNKIKEIKAILNNELSKKVLIQYPIKEYPFMLKLQVNLMKWRKIYALYFITKIKEYVKEKIK